uniref:Ninjurin a n=1 Tax=Glossina brevipalpis TaxID=37001 RepID=A0A1A9WFH4_9MUSC
MTTISTTSATISSTEQSFNSASGGSEISKENQSGTNVTEINELTQSLDILNSKREKHHAIRVEDGNRTNMQLYAANKNVAEGLMDIALLSANANQLRFLLTYNHQASTFYISLTLVAVSLILQVLVGIALIFKRRFRRCHNKRFNEFVIGGVFIITVVNILLAAFTTTTSTTDAK